MPINRTGSGMAATITDREERFSPLERLIYRFLRKVGPYRQAITERRLFKRAATVKLYQEDLRNYFVAGAGTPTAGYIHLQRMASRRKNEKGLYLLGIQIPQVKEAL